MAERPVRLIVPPQAPAQIELEPPPLVSIPRRPRFDQPVYAGIAVMGHAGRITDKLLITALGWAPGDRLSLDVADDAITLTRNGNGTSELDQRGQVIIPSRARGRVGIATGDRVLLVARPARDELILHPHHVLIGLWLDYYQPREGVHNDDHRPSS